MISVGYAGRGNIGNHTYGWQGRGDFSHGHARLHVAYNAARLHRAHGRNNTSWHKAHGNTNARLHEAHGNIRPYYNAEIGIQNNQGLWTTIWPGQSNNSILRMGLCAALQRLIQFTMPGRITAYQNRFILTRISGFSCILIAGFPTLARPYCDEISKHRVRPAHGHQCLSIAQSIS